MGFRMKNFNIMQSMEIHWKIWYLEGLQKTNIYIGVNYLKGLDSVQI